MDHALIRFRRRRPERIGTVPACDGVTQARCSNRQLSTGEPNCLTWRPSP
jgi:hypothetical protein